VSAERNEFLYANYLIKTYLSLIQPENLNSLAIMTKNPKLAEAL